MQEKTSVEETKPCSHHERIIPKDFGASFAISGCLAATFKTMIAPFERIKLILQTQTSSQQICRSRKAGYSGFLDAVVAIPREQGFLSLWRGNFTNICRYIPTQAINFSFYDVYYRALVKMLHPETDRDRDVLSFLAGGIVGVTSGVIVYPLTFCTTRISVDVGDNRNIKREFQSLTDCLCKIFRHDGFKGFYQGLPCSVAGMFLYRSTYFGVYVTGKRAYLNDYSFDSTSHKVNAPFLVSLGLAQLASTISTFISYPLDTIARQKMLWSGRGYVTMREVTTRIIRKDGLPGFYRGVFTHLITTLSGSLILATYDLIKEYYQRLKEAKTE